MQNIRWKPFLTVCVFSAILPLTGFSKDSKESARPKRGSIELGKGAGAQTDGGKVDELNRLFGKVVEAVTPSVVSITTEKKWSQQQQLQQNPLFEFFGMPQQPNAPEDNSPKRNIPLGGGSGFIVAKEGYIFTNAHVVEGADIVKVALGNNKTYVAKVVGVDKKVDVAVIQIDAPLEDLKPVDFGDSRKLQIGEWVLAIGNPFALQNTVTTGIVSAKGRRDQFGGDSYQDFIQTDAAVNPGNSGGPLVNLRGEVVGINSSIYTRNGGFMGVSFAIPVNMAVKVAEDLIYEGKVTRGFLGIGIDNVDENLAGALGLPSPQGCLVRDIAPNSPASKSALKSGDIILKVDGATVQDAADLRNHVADLKPGNKYAFDIWRDGKKMVLDVKVGAKPGDGEDENDSTPAASEGDDGSGGFSSRKLGLRFVAVDTDARAKYQISKEVSGVVLVEVMDGSPAAENGMLEGMVITDYKRKADVSFQEVKQPKQLLDAVKTLAIGENIAFKVFYKGKTDLRALRAEE